MDIRSNESTVFSEINQNFNGPIGKTTNDGGSSQTFFSGVTMHPEFVRAMIPEFDPEVIEARRWIRKVERFGEVSGCSKGLLWQFAVMRLGVTAKLWYESVDETVANWENFKLKLDESFPARIDEADVHAELMKRTKLRDETYENFAYEIISKE